MDRAPTILAYAFVTVAAILVPLATVPLTISLGDPVVEFYGPKFVLALVALLLGWMALLSKHRLEPLQVTLSIVLFRGLGKFVSAFMLITLMAAAVVGPDLWTAMLGTPSRLDGAFIIITLFGLMQMSNALVREQLLHVPHVVSLAVSGGTLVALVLFMEKSGTHAWGWLIPQIMPIANPIATVGNIGALTNLLAITFVLAVVSTINRHDWTRWLHWTAAIILAAGVAMHAGRAGVSGAVLALLITTVLMLILRRPRWYVPAAGAVLLVATLAIGTLLSSWTAERSRLFAAMAPGATADLNLEHRFTTWSIGLRSMVANPLLGTGTASFAEQVWAHATPADELVLYTAFVPSHLVTQANRVGTLITAYDPETEELVVRVSAYDKVHNYFLDIGVAYGLFSLAALLVLWSAILLTSWRLFASHPELLAVSLAYLAALQFWFMSITVDPLAYVAVGALSAAAYVRTTAVSAGEVSTNSPPRRAGLTSAT